MLNTCFTYQKRQGSTYQKFDVIDVLEVSNLDDKILHYLAREVVVAYINPELLVDAYRVLAEDAGELKLDILKEFLETKILPDSEKMHTRVGNFGEIMAARFLIEFEGFELPIYKLRFREKRDWAVRLTDLCLIKAINSSKPLVCYGEVKTNSSRCDLNLACQGHNSLAKDDALKDPEILRFICGWLYETNKFTERQLILKIWLDKVEYDKRHDLFLIHDKAHWDEQTLVNLENLEIDTRLVNFSVKAVLVTNLRHVIDCAYAQTAIAAGAKV